MSKIKQAELEDRAVDIAGKVLDRIENETLNGGKPKTIKSENLTHLLSI